MTGAKQIMQAQAVNNHNIANINTVGFRADSVAFVSQPIYGAGLPTRVNAVAGDSGTDFSSGVMQSTGRALDVAVNGKGYIAVLGMDGKEGLHARRRSARRRRRGCDHRQPACPVLTESGPLEHTAVHDGDRRQRRYGVGRAARPDPDGRSRRPTRSNS